MSAFEDKSGKINAADFKKILLPKQGAMRKELLQGPAFGVDTSLINLGNGQGLAVSSDPLSLIPSLGMKESAWLSVVLLVNDMATTGFAPQFAQFTLNLPDSISRNDFEEYWSHIHQYCKNFGIAITGGHTGQIPGQHSTISGAGTMFLKAPISEILQSNGVQSGDSIIMTKSCALMASVMLGCSFPKTVTAKLGKDVLKKAKAGFYKTEVLTEAGIASSVLKPNSELKAMHDVTEGGVMGAISEMAGAGGCGFKVQGPDLHTEDWITEICQLFNIDPYYSLGAGSMIMAVKKGSEQRLMEALEGEDIPAAVIGTFTERENEKLLIRNGKEEAVPSDTTDPYWAAYFKATQKGWV